jgi:hypothetical protein
MLQKQLAYEEKSSSQLQEQSKRILQNSPRLPPNLPPNLIVLLLPLPVQNPLLRTADTSRADLIDVETHRTVFDVLLHGGRDGAVRCRLPDEPAHALQFQHGVHGVGEFAVEGVGAGEVGGGY